MPAVSPVSRLARATPAKTATPAAAKTISHASVSGLGSGWRQRECACAGAAGPSGECESCRKKREAGLLQRKISGQETPHSTFNAQRFEAPPIVHEVLQSPGEPLATSTRAFMETRFGHDFSTVRVHHDSRAAESARAVQAHAYTVARNIVFAPGAYSPDTPGGRELIAHELTHVVQQASPQESAPPSGISIDPSPAAEHQAREIACRVMREPSLGAIPIGGIGGLQRLPVSLQRGSDQCSRSGTTCASPDACTVPDKGPEKEGGQSTAWALTVNVDIERDDWETALRKQELGHTYVHFIENSGREFTYGFYPAAELPNETKREVLGCVHHPDTTHEKCIDDRVNYSLTQEQYNAAITTAQKVCKDKRLYGVNYTCTTFAAEVVAAAGQTLPSSRSAKTTIYSQPIPEIDNPNTLHENIEREKAKNTGKKGFWNSSVPPVLRLRPVAPVKLSDDPNKTIFKFDWIPIEGGSFRWRLLDDKNRHYLLRGALGDNDVLDWLSFTENRSALIGQKTRDLLKQRSVARGTVQCTFRAPALEDQVVSLAIEFIL